MVVVVTGVTGHAGANLVRALLDEDRPLRAHIRSFNHLLIPLDE